MEDWTGNEMLDRVQEGAPTTNKVSSRGCGGVLASRFSQLGVKRQSFVHS